MKKILMILLAALMLLAAGCAAKNQTAAETYLANHSEQEILAYFSEASLFYYDFNNPKEIPTGNLYNFVLFHDNGSWYNEADKLYYIPLADIDNILQSYLTEYDFQTESFGEYYDAANQQIFTTAIGMGTGCTAHDFIKAKAVDKENLEVTLLRYCSDPEVDSAAIKVIITAQIVDGQAKFTSCQSVLND